MQSMQGRRKLNRARATKEKGLGGRDLYWSGRRLEYCRGIETRPNLTFPVEMGDRYFPCFCVPDLGSTERRKLGVNVAEVGLTPW